METESTAVVFARPVGDCCSGPSLNGVCRMFDPAPLKKGKRPFCWAHYCDTGDPALFWQFRKNAACLATKPLSAALDFTQTDHHQAAAALELASPTLGMMQAGGEWIQLAESIGK